MNNTTLIFHHNDNDGKAAAAIIMQNIIDIGTGDYKLIECDYTKTLHAYGTANCRCLRMHRRP